jgi:hypothetical protein
MLADGWLGVSCSGDVVTTVTRLESSPTTVNATDDEPALYAVTVTLTVLGTLALMLSDPGSILTVSLGAHVYPSPTKPCAL